MNLSYKQLIETATSYDELLVPAVFYPWAQKMQGFINTSKGSEMLDIACGTGVLGRVLLEHSPHLKIKGLDLNQGMLEVANRHEKNIEWVQGDAKSIPFPNDSFDIVTTQFGLMLFQNPGKALKEMLRVMKPGAVLYIAVFDQIANNPGYKIMADLFGRMISEDLGNSLRFPFSLGDPDRLGEVLTEAGISDYSHVTQISPARFQNARHMVLADVKGWFPFAGINLSATDLEKVCQEAEKELEPMTLPTGEVVFDISVQLITYENQ